MLPEQEIENRSGASKRKKRKEQLDEWNRLQSKLPRLLSFGFSIQNEPNHPMASKKSWEYVARARAWCVIANIGMRYQDVGMDH